MKYTLFTWIVLVVGATAARAEDVSYASYRDIAQVLEQQNARIEELETALEASPWDTRDDCCQDCCGESCCSGSCGGCDPCCRSAGIIGGAELMFLKPHSSLGTRGAVTDIDFGYDPAPRVWLGYQGSDGLGFRVRYWEFDHRKDVAGRDALGNPVVDSLSYDTYTLDAEFFDSLNLGCYWDASLSVGFRYLEFDQERVAIDATTRQAFLGDQFDNSSLGLTLGGELRRCMGCGLAGFLNSRASVLMGDEVESQIGAGGNWSFVDREIDNLYYIWEAQAGVQWTQESGGGHLFARAAAEVQMWDNAAGTGEDWGLGGFLFSAGVIR
jgi:hypothetical protein